MFQSESTSSSSLKAVKINTDVRRFRITSNRKYLKTLTESLE